MRSYNLNELAAQPIYYYPFKFNEYKFEEYTITNPEYYSGTYIVGYGFKNPYTSAARNTSKWMREGFICISTADFLEDMLSFGGRLLDQNDNPLPPFSPESQSVIMECVNKYGLYHETLFTKRSKKDGTQICKYGCSRDAFVSRLQNLRIQYNQMCAITERTADLSCFTHNYFPAQLIVHTAYDEGKNRFESYVVAPTLIDVALFQLSTLFESGIPHKKCQNPACTKIIIGGRSDRKTCSDACRQAYSRLRKANV